MQANPISIAVCGVAIAMLVALSGRAAAEDAPTSQAGPGVAPSRDTICTQRLGEGTLGHEGKALEDAERLMAELAPPSETPPVVAPAQPASPAQPTESPAWRHYQAKEAESHWHSELIQAQRFQQLAAAEVEAAKNSTDANERQRHEQDALKLLDKRDGLTATLALELKSASSALTGAAPPAQPSQPSQRLHANDSPTLNLLKKMSLSASDAARAFDGSADRAYQDADRGPGTHFFSLPTASGPQKQPGGIKFSGARAEELASALDVTSITFDAVRGRIVLAGSKMNAAQAFDLDVFADVLRLAAEEYEPFFSLDPSEPTDWDKSPTRIAEALVRKYSSDELAHRVRAFNPVGLSHGNRTYYYATVEALDADLAAEANQGSDLTVKVVYSPAWLRYSKVGAILFDADLAIKSVASGFLERDGSIEPAFVWQLPDFEPAWLHRDDESAGRANFELAHALVRQSGARLDLAEIHPGLYVTERRAGTNQDLAPSSHDQLISRFFDLHWHDYATNVPEIARLEMVFRAYVAARFLINHHPGLAARIQAMPREVPPEQPPLRIVMPTVIRVAFEGDRPVPIVPGMQASYDLSLGYGGGVKFGIDEPNGSDPRVVVQDVPIDSNDWVSGLLAAATYGDEGCSEEMGRGAAVLEFDSPGLPVHWHLKMISAIAALVLLIAGAALVLRQFDWQQLALTPTCRHCVRVHGRLGRIALPGSAITAAGMMYLGVLPLVASYDVPWSATQTIAAAAVLVAVVISFMLLGFLARALSRTSGDAPRNRGAATAVFTGATVTCLAFAAYLFHRGFSGAAVGSTLTNAFGAAIAERVFARLGGVGPIAVATLVAAGGCGITLLTRWAAPYAWNSRPLPLHRLSDHSHSPARA